MLRKPQVVFVLRSETRSSSNSEISGILSCQRSNTDIDYYPTYDAIYYAAEWPLQAAGGDDLFADLNHSDDAGCDAKAFHVQSK